MYLNQWERSEWSEWLLPFTLSGSVLKPLQHSTQSRGSDQRSVDTMTSGEKETGAEIDPANPREPSRREFVAASVAMTAACGTTAPVSSEIVPVSSPVTRELCALNGVEKQKMIASCIKTAKVLSLLNTELLFLEVQGNSRKKAHVDV